MNRTTAGGTVSVEVDAILFDRVPAYRRIVFVASLDRAADPVAVRAVFEPALGASAQLTAVVAELTEFPPVLVWRQAFRAVGLDPTKTRPAREALLRRAVAGTLRHLGRR